jgi:hypothetical protein
MKPVRKRTTPQSVARRSGNAVAIVGDNNASLLSGLEGERPQGRLDDDDRTKHQSEYRMVNGLIAVC